MPVDPACEKSSYSLSTQGGRGLLQYFLPVLAFNLSNRPHKVDGVDRPDGSLAERAQDSLGTNCIRFVGHDTILDTVSGQTNKNKTPEKFFKRRIQNFIRLDFQAHATCRVVLTAGISHASVKRFPTTRQTTTASTSNELSSTVILCVACITINSFPI